MNIGRQHNDIAVCRGRDVGSHISLLKASLEDEWNGRPWIVKVDRSIRDVCRGRLLSSNSIRGGTVARVSWSVVVGSYDTGSVRRFKHGWETIQTPWRSNVMSRSLHVLGSADSSPWRTIAALSHRMIRAPSWLTRAFMYNPITTCERYSRAVVS